jgi:hypothetical protein
LGFGADCHLGRASDAPVPASCDILRLSATAILVAYATREANASLPAAIQITATKGGIYARRRWPVRAVACLWQSALSITT